MILRPCGIYSANGENYPAYKASDFSNELYDGVRCGYDKRTKSPVVIMHCKHDAPMRWKVVYGFSTIFFETFKDAMEFCKSRDMKMFKAYEDERYDG